jgi:hypothetical protein
LIPHTCQLTAEEAAEKRSAPRSFGLSVGL